MHPCLTIVELQHAIFRQIRSNRSSGKDNATLARLAYTCRTFSDVALDILWEDSSIPILVQCLPKDLCKIEHQGHGKVTHVKFQRSMSVSDWEIFRKYASRVRSLSQFEGDEFRPKVILDDNVTLALSQPPDNGVLIPQLKSLAWVPHLCLLPVVFTHTLEHVTLPSFALRIPKIPLQLTSACPSLKSLRIITDVVRDVLSGDRDDQKVLSETVMRLSSLQSLDCHTLDEAAILYLSRLPSFTKLALDPPDTLHLGTLKRGVIPPVFVSLQSLTLRVHKFSDLIALLEIMHFKPRDVSFLVNAVPTTDALRLCFNTLIKTCDPMKITKFSLWSYPSRGLPPGSECGKVSLSTFCPLFALRNLMSFEFEVLCDVLLDDQGITMMAGSWPNLTSLALNLRHGWGTGSRVTHRGLITLLSRCPALDTLTLVVDFTEIDRPLSAQTPTSYGITHPCGAANFLASPVRHPRAIAAFLQAICPKLLLVLSQTHAMPQEGLQYAKKWEEVKKLMLPPPAETGKRYKSFQVDATESVDPTISLVTNLLSLFASAPV